MLLIPRRKTETKAKMPPDTAAADAEIKRVREQFTVKTEIRRSQLPRAGRGLYAAQDIKEGEWIVEYTGEVIEYREARLRGLKGRASHIRSLLPLVWCIDGAKACSGGAMANDPRDIRKTNAKMVNYHTRFNEFLRNPKHSLVYLKALRNIEAGEEIYVDYGCDYWTSHLGLFDGDTRVPSVSREHKSPY